MMASGPKRLLVRGALGLSSLFVAASLVPTVVQVARLAMTFAIRARYPMDIDWLEGSEIYHAARLLRGMPIYGPSPDGFVSHPYPPGHFLALAAVGRVFGLDYGVARALSIAATGVAMLVAGGEVLRHTRGLHGAWAAVVVIGLVATGYPVTNAWYDLGRNDSVALVLPLVAAALVSSTPVSTAQVVASACLMVAAIYTKQTGVFFFPAIAFFLGRSGRHWIPFVVLSAALGLSLLGLAQAITGGAFWVRMIELGGQSVEPRRAWDGARTVILHAPYLALLPVLVAVLVRRKKLSPRSELWAFMFVAASLAGLIPFAKDGGWFNNLMPLLVVGPIAFALVAADAVRELSLPPVAARLGLACLAAAQSGYQLARGIDHDAFRPSLAAQQQAQAIARRIGSLEGDVVCPTHPFVVARIKPGVPQESWISRLDAARGRAAPATTAAYVERLVARRPEWLLLTGLQVEEPLREAIHPYYEHVETIGEDSDRWTKDRPTLLFRRR